MSLPDIDLQYTKWLSTAFIRTSDVVLVCRAIEMLMQREGYQALPSDTPIEVGDSWHSPETGMIAIVPGAAGWSIVRTLPLNFLIYPAPGSPFPRLHLLANTVGVPALHVGIEDYDTVCIIESFSELHVHGAHSSDDEVTGMFYESDEFMEAFNQMLETRDSPRQVGRPFMLIEELFCFNDGDWTTHAQIEALCKSLGGDNWKFASNEGFDQFLDGELPPPEGLQVRMLNLETASDDDHIS